MMRSGVLDADTTIKKIVLFSQNHTNWLAEATFTSFDKKPILVTCILKGNFKAVLKVNFPSISVTAPQHPYDCNISPYYGQFVTIRN
jgi:hypothetical protein